VLEVLQVTGMGWRMSTVQEILFRRIQP